MYKRQLLRLLEVPVFQIQALQKGETTLHNVMDLQEKKFSEEIREKEELLKLCKRVKIDCSNFESLTVIAPEGNGEYWHRMNGKILCQDKIRHIEARMALLKDVYKRQALFGTVLNAAGMNTIVGYVYDMLYGSSGGYPSYASAAAILLFAIVLTITCINLLISRKHVHYI